MKSPLIIAAIGTAVWALGGVNLAARDILPLRPRVQVEVTQDGGVLDQVLQKGFSDKFLKHATESVLRKLNGFCPSMGWYSGQSRAAPVARLTVQISQQDGEFKAALNGALYAEAATPLADLDSWTFFGPLEIGLGKGLKGIEGAFDGHLDDLFKRQDVRRALVKSFISLVPLAARVEHVDPKSQMLIIPVDAQRMRLMNDSIVGIRLLSITTQDKALCPTESQGCVAHVSTRGPDPHSHKLEAKFDMNYCCSWPADASRWLEGRRLKVFLTSEHDHCPGSEQCEPDHPRQREDE